MIGSTEHLTRAVAAAGYAPGGLDALFDGPPVEPGLRALDVRSAALWTALRRRRAAKQRQRAWTLTALAAVMRRRR